MYSFVYIKLALNSDLISEETEKQLYGAQPLKRRRRRRIRKTNILAYAGDVVLF